MGSHSAMLIDIYMAMGGVPKYLSYIARGKSAAQIINDVCLSLNGGLYNEFDNLYKSLFENYEYHVAIVKTVSLRKALFIAKGNDRRIYKEGE